MIKILTMSELVNKMPKDETITKELTNYVEKVINTEFPSVYKTNKDDEVMKRIANYIQYLENERLAILQYRRWLLQPFKPELITELFEGWELSYKSMKYVATLKSNKNEIVLHERRNYMTMFRYDTSICCEVYYPRNLNDFVNDCERYGIDLYLKEKT